MQNSVSTWRWITRTAAWLAMVATTGTSLRAQPAFGPPPVPKVSPAQVRGLVGAPQASTSPAQVASPPTTVQPTTPIVPPSANERQGFDLGDAKPLEGGQIVARIDGEVVLASDVLWIVNLIVEQNSDRIPPNQMEEARQALLRQQVMGLIDTKVLFADFKRNVPSENLPRIQESLAEPFEEMEIPRLSKMLEADNRIELEQTLRKYGTSLSDLRRQFVERTVAGEWLRQLSPKPQPATHEQMLAYYQEHKQEYEYPSQVRWEELMVRFDRLGGDRSAAWKAITAMGNQVWQQVVQNRQLRGPIFTDVAREQSHGFTAKEGGQHDWTTRGALRSSEIDQALFRLKVGQLSNVIESESGFHIIRVLERKEAGCTPFSEAQADIRQALEDEAKKSTGNVELENLRSRSRIWTIFDGEFRGSQLAQIAGGTLRK